MKVWGPTTPETLEWGWLPHPRQKAAVFYASGRKHAARHMLVTQIRSVTLPPALEPRP